MIGGENGQIALTQSVLESRNPGVELLECGAVARNIVAVSVLLIEIHQIHENQAIRGRLHRVERGRHSVRIVPGLGAFANTAPQENIEDFPYAVNEDSALLQLIEQHPFRRRHRVVVAVSGARKVVRRARERPCDHASHFIRTL